MNKRSIYLKHNAVFDRESRSWFIDETKLDPEDIAFFKKEGVIKEDKEEDKEDTGVMPEPVEEAAKAVPDKYEKISNIEIILILRNKEFKTFPEDEQIRIVKALTLPIRDDKDMDIPYPDFYRIAKIEELVNREDFLRKVDYILKSEDKDKDEVMEKYRFTKLEQALFKYEWLK